MKKKTKGSPHWPTTEQNIVLKHNTCISIDDWNKVIIPQVIASGTYLTDVTEKYYVGELSFPNIMICYIYDEAQKKTFRCTSQWTGKGVYIFDISKSIPGARILNEKEFKK